jgi:hypothetical protein
LDHPTIESRSINSHRKRYSIFSEESVRGSLFESKMISFCEALLGRRVVSRRVSCVRSNRTWRGQISLQRTQSSHLLFLSQRFNECTQKYISLFIRDESLSSAISNRRPPQAPVLTRISQYASDLLADARHRLQSSKLSIALIVLIDDIKNQRKVHDEAQGSRCDQRTCGPSRRERDLTIGQNSGEKVPVCFVSIRIKDREVWKLSVGRGGWCGFCQTMGCKQSTPCQQNGRVGNAAGKVNEMSEFRGNCGPL